MGPNPQGSPGIGFCCSPRANNDDDDDNDDDVDNNENDDDSDNDVTTLPSLCVAVTAVIDRHVKTTPVMIEWYGRIDR